MKTCQHELHCWGAANQVAFDAAKESRHILSVSDPMGDGFRLLGVAFDEELSMSEAVSKIVSSAGWKLRTLLRTRRFYTDSDLISLYKAHLLSFLEYRTPAVYHATRAILSRLDAVQSRFLNNIGVDEVIALAVFQLAPLSVRRDIAMLGLIHRIVVGKGPSQFTEHFQCQGQSLRDPRRDSKAPLIRCSALGVSCNLQHASTEDSGSKNGLPFPAGAAKCGLQGSADRASQVAGIFVTASEFGYTSTCLTFPGCP